MVAESFRSGDMVSVDGFVSVWADDLSSSCDSMMKGEVAVVLRDEDGYGWVVTMSPRGYVGLVHQSNLRWLYRSEEVVL